MLQCVAVCCSMKVRQRRVSTSRYCVAACCSMLRCAVVGCSALQHESASETRVNVAKPNQMQSFYFSPLCPALRVPKNAPCALSSHTYVYTLYICIYFLDIHMYILCPDHVCIRVYFFLSRHKHVYTYIPCPAPRVTNHPLCTASLSHPDFHLHILCSI